MQGFHLQLSALDRRVTEAREELDKPRSAALDRRIAQVRKELDRVQAQGVRTEEFESRLDHFAARLDDLEQTEDPDDREERIRVGNQLGAEFGNFAWGSLHWQHGQAHGRGKGRGRAQAAGKS